MKKNCFFIFLSVFIGVLALVSPVHAGGFAEYSKEIFASAQADNKAVLLDFYASWCSTCREQQSILKGLSQDEAFGDIIILTVDYDNSDSLKHKLNVNRQSTLIMFKGDQEVGRETGLTDKGTIRELIKKGL